KLSADQELARLTQTVQALIQEQSDLTTALHLLNEEIRQCHANVEARSQEKNQRERFLTEKQTELIELREAEEAVETAVTQSRIRSKSSVLSGRPVRRKNPGYSSR